MNYTLKKPSTGGKVMDFDGNYTWLWISSVEILIFVSLSLCSYK